MAKKVDPSNFDSHPGERAFWQAIYVRVSLGHEQATEDNPYITRKEGTLKKPTQVPALFLPPQYDTQLTYSPPPDPILVLPPHLQVEQDRRQQELIALEDLHRNRSLADSAAAISLVIANGIKRGLSRAFTAVAIGALAQIPASTDAPAVSPPPTSNHPATP